MSQSDKLPAPTDLKDRVAGLSPGKLDRLNNCPKLASLQSIYKALASLLESDHAYLSQIAELIGRDPPLTSRLLKLVNSVFYGLHEPCTNIEEAALAAGLDQISELILSTPIIEDLQKLQEGEDSIIDWTKFWQHSIATAILSRELFSIRQDGCRGDIDYIAGLIHNVGKIIMALVFPEDFATVSKKTHQDEVEEIKAEEKVAGADHAVLGAFYLNANRLPFEIVESTLCHVRPLEAVEYPVLSAAIQVAAALARLAGICGIENLPIPEWQDIEQLDGWRMLFGNNPAPPHVRNSLDPTLERLEVFLSGMV